MKNKKNQECCWCGFLLSPGEGNLFKVDEEDEDIGFGPMGVTGWLVSCIDKSACGVRREENKRKRKEEIEKKRAEDQMERDLFPWDGGEYVPALNGEKILLTGEDYERPGKGHNIYGGGLSYCDTGDYIWSIKNNGMDGDDWSMNNISTGGAGAIGRRFERTQERLLWLSTIINVSERKREEARKGKIEKERIRQVLIAAVERAGGWEAMEEKMKKAGLKEFCPREMMHQNGRAMRLFSIAEAKRIVG